MKTGYYFLMMFACMAFIIVYGNTDGFISYVALFIVGLYIGWTTAELEKLNNKLRRSD